MFATRSQRPSGRPKVRYWAISSLWRKMKFAHRPRGHACALERWDDDEMDPLSVVASVATLIEAVAVVSGALKMLRSELADAPRSLCALINEISDLHILLESCESALRHWHKATPGSTFPVSLAKSNQIIESTHESVKELTNIARRCVSASVDEQQHGMSFSSKMRWLREKGDAKKLQQKLGSDKDDLILLLEAHNFGKRHGITDIQLSIDEIIFGTEKLHAAADLSHEKILERLALQAAKLEAVEKAQYDVAQKLDNFRWSLGDQATRESGQTTDTHQPTSAQRHSGLNNYNNTLQVKASCYRRSCRPWCSCSCHARQGFKSPDIMSRFLGSLFIGYSGVPGLVLPCDEKHCHSRSNLRVITSYQFPKWFMEKALYTCFASSRLNGPELLLRVQNTIPYASETYQHCLSGEVVRLRNMFERGLASPFDVDPDGLSLLHNSIRCLSTDRSAQLQMIALLISYGANLYQEDHSGLSAYHYAWDNILQDPSDSARNSGLIELFPQEEGGLDERQFCRIHKTVLGLIGTRLPDELDISTALIECTDNVGRTPLFWAARRGDAHAIRNLLEYGADPNKSAPGADDRSPLQSAAMAGCHAGVEDLLKAGAVVEHADKFGIRALHDAAGANDGNTIIELLLRYGAKVDVRDSEGRTAVLMASQNGMLSNTLVLLRNGADINLDAEGWTPLFSCIFWNMHDSIRLLLKEGADVTLKTHEDDSILHVAAQYADIETLIILMEVDLGSVNPQDKNIKDETASHVALSRGDEEDEWQKKFCRLVQRISDHRSKRPPLDLTGADHRPKVEALQNKSLDFEVAIYAVEKNGSESGDSMYEDAVEVHFVDHT